MILFPFTFFFNKPIVKWLESPRLSTELKVETFEYFLFVSIGQKFQQGLDQMPLRSKCSKAEDAENGKLKQRKIQIVQVPLDSVGKGDWHGGEESERANL